jgi:hypothetical protein
MLGFSAMTVKNFGDDQSRLPFIRISGAYVRNYLSIYKTGFIIRGVDFSLPVGTGLIISQDRSSDN